MDINLNANDAMDTGLQQEKPTTAEAKVFENVPLLKNIIKHLPSRYPRSQLRTLSTAFYRASNPASSIIPTVSLNEGKRVPFVSDHGEMAVIYRRIFINVKNSDYFYEGQFNEYEKLLGICAMKGYQLIIKSLPIEGVQFLDYSISHSNIIDDVCFKTEASPIASLDILNNSLHLHPKNVRFEDYSTREEDSFQNSNVSDIHVFFPSYVENVTMMCSRRKFFCLLKPLSYRISGSFDTLTLGRFSTKGNVTSRELECISEMSKSFDNVKLIFNENMTGDINKFIFVNLNKFLFTTNANVSYDITAFMYCIGNPFVKLLEKKITCNENVLWKKYGNIKAFRVFLQKESVVGILTELELQSLNFGLKKMVNLETFELDLRLVNSILQFEEIISGMNKSVKNLKLYECTEKFNVDYLEILVKYLPQLENLDLRPVNSNSILLIQILSGFKNLKGLSIDFGMNYSYENSIMIFSMVHPERETMQFRWPDLNFLELTGYCDQITKNHIETMERNTPRRAGQFLYFADEGGYTYNRRNNTISSYLYASHIIFQSNINEHIKFKRMFTVGKVPLDDETLYGNPATFEKHQDI